MVWGTKSRHERGYGAEWDRLRTRIMQRDGGLCQVCKRKGIVSIATAVDHIVSKANATRMKWTPVQIDAETNLQAICKPCHLVKTEEEQGKVKRVKRGVGPDGWPI